jgi:hypothetical protein
MYTLRKENRSYIYILTMEMKFYLEALFYLQSANWESAIWDATDRTDTFREL